MNEDFSLRPDEIALIRPFLHDRLRRVISQGQPVHKRSYDQFSQPVQLEFDGGAFQVYNSNFAGENSQRPLKIKAL